MTPFSSWIVFRGNRRIDCVYFEATVTRTEVKRSLVEHDGYSPSIRVIRRY
jgi:hypothetical protein